jgi:hypothetical protein
MGSRRFFSLQTVLFPAAKSSWERFSEKRQTLNVKRPAPKELACRFLYLQHSVFVPA